MIKLKFGSAFLLILVALQSHGQQSTLDIYFIDVEGGAARGTGLRER